MSVALNANNKTMLDLNKLVNLALNSPRVGVVNFNILKTFLIELLKALNLQHYEPKFGDDSETKNLLQHIIKANEENDSVVHDESHMDETGYESMINMSLDGSGIAGAPSAKTNRTQIQMQQRETKPMNERFFNLEDKLSRLEQQLNAINTLPPNAQLIEKAKESKKTNSSTGPILEIWQYTQLSKRLESTEDGLTKLTSIMQDLIGDINDLKDGQAKNAGELQRLNDRFHDLNDKFKNFDKLKDNFPSKEELQNLERELDALREGLANASKLDEKLKAMQNQLKLLEAKLTLMIKSEDLVDFVTWPALEQAMKGLKDLLDKSLEDQKKVLPPIQTQTQTQTTPQPSRPNTGQSGRVIPSQSFLELLEKLGSLNDRHENLKELVESMRNELAEKLEAFANRPKSAKKETQSLKLPDDFAAKLDEIMKLRTELDELRRHVNQESGKRIQLENLISNLNSELDKLKQLLKECLESSKLNRDDIKALEEAIKILDQTKADKDWVRAEFDKKADKRDLDSRVQRKQFEDSINEISNNINNCLQKTNTLEDDMKREHEKIAKELDCKLDRLELDPLKEYIEKQLKKLKKIQKEAQDAYITPGGEEAAGMRKQLLRFHCISCDRPVEALPQPPLPSLPNERGMRPIQSPRPFTTYELDQIRQFQRQQNQTDAYDLFSTVRQAGGSHTLTLPHKRVIKVPPQLNEEPPIALPNYKPEVQIQGQDGHIYKGRIDAKLSVELKKPKNSNSHNSNSLNANIVNIERPNSVAHNRPISTKYNNGNINNININNNNNNNINSVNSTAKPSTPNTNVKSEVDDDQLDPIPVYTN